MKISIRKTRQFPDGIIRLDDEAPGKETIVMAAKQRHEIWITGQSEGPNPIFGHMKIRISQGPLGFGLEISRGIGDVPLTIDDGTGKHQAEGLFVYELYPEPTGPKEWRPSR